MTHDVIEAPAVREPKQFRTREAWTRVLDVGLKLLEEGGPDALTVTEVCRLGRISPPSLYARVDGKAGLFAAVYEFGMARVRTTESELLEGLRTPSSPAAQARGAARVLDGVFRRHRRFLKAVITLAGTDERLLEHGAAESQRFLHELAQAMPACGDRADDTLRSLYAECVLRTMYGAAFLTDRPEGDAEFTARLELIAERMAVG